MTDFTEGFATGFEVVALIKEKQKAKKAMQEVQNTLQEWQLSGKEPSYVDKLMLGLTVTKVGENYSKIYNDITNSKDSYDKEKMSQSAINLREYNDQVLNFVKMIQTSAKEGTLDLIPWDSVQALMPDVDLTKVLSSIPELKNKQYEAKTKEQNIDIYGKTPESIRQGVGEQLGVIPEGVQPTPKEAPQMSAADSFFIERWQKGEFSTDTLLKHFSAWVDTDKRTNLQKELEYGREQGVTFTPEEVKKKILGTAGGGGEEEPVLRTDIAYWEKTFNTVKSEDEYNRQIELLKQSKTSKQYNPKPYKEILVNKVKAQAEEIKATLLTTDSKGNVIFRGDKEKDSYPMYQQIYEKKVRELMALYPDIDVSQFPKFLPIEQIKKVGTLKGIFTTSGVSKGDYSVIDPKGW